MKENNAVFDEFMNKQHISNDKESARRPDRQRWMEWHYFNTVVWSSLAHPLGNTQKVPYRRPLYTL